MKSISHSENSRDFNVKKIYITRESSDTLGTYGILQCDTFECQTLELPWRDNQPNISCIPFGIYDAYVDTNVTIGTKYVIRLQKVPNRTGVLIHVGNYIEEIAGCILVGSNRITNNQQKIITSSRLTMKQLLEIVNSNFLQVIVS